MCSVTQETKISEQKTAIYNECEPDDGIEGNMKRNHNKTFNIFLAYIDPVTRKYFNSIGFPFDLIIVYSLSEITYGSV